MAIYTEQAAALEKAGVDLFVIETMTTMAEARAAVLACKSVSDKPVWVSFTCDEEGRTPSGTDVLAALIVMQGMGASAFGLNCTDPAVTAEQLARLTPYATVPLLAKPNAGVPGAYCTPAELAAYVPAYAQAGARIFGGCCGAGPDHLAAVKGAVEGVDFSSFPPVDRDPDVIPCASEKEARFITPDVDVGEMIECTPDLMEDILDGGGGLPPGGAEDRHSGGGRPGHLCGKPVCGEGRPVPLLRRTRAAGAGPADLPGPGLLGRHSGSGGGFPPGYGPKVRPGPAIALSR